MPSDETQPSASESPRELNAVVRRSAKLSSFMWLGAIVGAILAAILTFAFPEHPEFSRGQVFGFLLVFVTALSVLLFLVIGLIVNFFVGRRTGTATITRVDD
ncbi:hypothetical protein EG850_06450 [Gulosibacter macacae]|uniref:Potassium transporter Trk n=1 Tax=Gulosibacter macacae TaxID=2488791 RepID=A0A3P3VXG1_9MICO|nr:hypothetical protein [Gulosibacter macacae]RRJ87037.1 hypothetical protein EG850_06450 [Gulosibacter macacae]